MTLVRRGRGAISQPYMPILFLIVFIDLVGFGLVIPLLPFYAERFGASPLQMTRLFAAALSAVALLGVVFLLRESLSATAHREPRGRIAALRDALRRPMLGRLLVLFFLVILAFSGMETTFAWWAIDRFGWGPRPIGFVFFYVGLLSAAMQGGLIGPLTRRFGEERLTLAGLVLIALGLLVLPFAREVPALVLALTLLSLGMG